MMCLKSDYGSFRSMYIEETLHRTRGSAVAWWLMPRTPDPEVGGSSPTRVKPCCVLEQGTFTPKSTGNTQEAVALSQHD